MPWLRRLCRGWLLIVLAWFAMAAGATAQDSATPGSTILTSRVSGAITPVIADHLTEGVRQAEAGGHQAFLVELDTPGGLDASMRQIIQAFLGARVPVVVYVTPPGARAASAGALITSAAHVAAMAPGTTIGAATPVGLQGGEISQKVVNDAAAYARSIATQRGRNPDFAEDTVRKGRAVPADEAVRLRAVDLVAPNRSALLTALDGRAVKLADGRTVVLRTRGVRLVPHDLGPLRSLLQLLADPNLAFLFLSLGTLAIIYELAHPGIGFGGTLGVILLILGFTALSVLPVNIAGLALLLLGAALFAAELYTPGTGVFAVGGALALLLAGLLLFQGPFGVSPGVLWPTVLVVAGGSLLAGRLAWRARRRPPVSGRELLLGREVEVRRAEGRTGRVLLEGAWWTARSRDVPLQKGQVVRVIALDGLDLIVEPVEPTEATHDC